MKRKSININQVKFLMERMEKKYTFDESIERVRTLMNEGIGDDIIKAAIRSTDEASVIKYANDIKVLEKRGSDLNNSIENFRNSFDKIRSGINLRDSLKGLPSARSMRITIEDFTDSFSNLLKNISADKGVIIGIDDIKNYINGVTDTYPTELLDVLNPENLAQLQIVQDGIKKLNLTNRELGHINDFAEIIGLSGNKPMDTRNLLISLIGRDGVESIDELKKSISDLDDLENLKFDLANELNGAWKRIKEETGLSSKSIDSQIQTVFRNDPAYKIVEGGLKTKIRNWVNSNLKKMDISLEKLRTKNVEWDKTIIYKNAKDGEIYVLQFKSADDVKRYQAYLNKYGLEFKEGATVEEAIVQIKEMATASNRVRKIKWWLIGGSVGSLLLYGAICASMKEDRITPEILEKRKEEFGEDAVVETDPWLIKFGDCYVGLLEAVANKFSGAVDVTQNIIEGFGQDLTMIACDALKELCENWECCHKENCEDKQPVCCMECNDESKIEALAKEYKVRFSELFDNAEKINKLKKYASDYGEDVGNLVKNNIEKDGMLASILFKDGERLSIAEFIKLICTKQNVKCVENRTNDIFTYITNEFNTKNCVTLKQERNIPIKIEELRRFNTAGYLTLDKSEQNKVYINWKEQSPILYGQASTVEECINIMYNMYQKVLLDFCADPIEEEEDIPVDTADYEVWCKDNGKDSSVVKSLMEYLWKEGVVKLECTTGEDGIEYMFRPNPERKTLTSYQIYDLFNKEFKSIFPQVEAFSDGWVDAFNYWYDKQKNECNF